MMPDPVVVVKGKLIDAKTGKPLGSKVVYEDLATGKEVGVAQSNPETGEYEISLPVGKQYGVRAEAKDHISSSQNLDLRKVTYGPVNKDMQLKPEEMKPIEVTPIAADAVIPLNNIFFEFDKAVLTSASYPELNRIVTLMNERKTMTVEIAGHTDQVGAEDYNLKLSERRAKAVSQYLMNKAFRKIVLQAPSLVKPSRWIPAIQRRVMLKIAEWNSKSLSCNTV